ncbi:MAG: hypothetical protein GY950_26535, partial [bacterium]|nr:hypothetical protein [bacterium]
ISTIYIYEALGSLLSGIVYTFLLVGRFNPYFIAALIILPLLLSCWAILNKTTFKLIRTTAVLLLIINAVTLTPFVSNKIENITVKKRWCSFSQLPLNYSIDSRYQNIAVAHLARQHNLYLNTMLAAVFPNDEDNMLLAAHLICRHPSPKRILVIGDAVSGLAKFLLRYDVEKLVSVEIDPVVVDTILAFLPHQEKNTIQKYREEGRFEIKIEDGRKYVNGLNRQKESLEKNTGFDIVYVNVPEPSTLLLNRFYTVDFFSDLSRILKKDGVVALQVTASENYTQGIVSDYTASVFNTVRSVFPYITVSPGPRNFIFASQTPGIISDTPGVLEERYGKTGVTPEHLGMIFHSLYPPGRTESTREALASHESYRLNTDETPVAGFYFNKIIGWYGKSRVSHLLGFFERVEAVDIVIFVFILFFARLVFIFVRRKTSPPARFLRFHTVSAVFACGMVGLALELVILYTFQNSFGDVYHLIGLIIAVFMFGLPLGALTSNAWIRRKGSAARAGIIKFLILIQVKIAVISLLLPYLVKLPVGFGFFNELVLFAATILIGFSIGLVFPLSVHLYLGGGERSGRAAGVIDAFDHMGAAVGAFFIGSLFLPVMGVERVCWLLALFPLLSAFLLITDIKKKNK